MKGISIVNKKRGHRMSGWGWTLSVLGGVLLNGGDIRAESRPTFRSRGSIASPVRRFSAPSSYTGSRVNVAVRAGRSYGVRPYGLRSAGYSRLYRPRYYRPRFYSYGLYGYGYYRYARYRSLYAPYGYRAYSLRSSRPFTAYYYRPPYYRPWSGASLYAYSRYAYARPYYGFWYRSPWVYGSYYGAPCCGVGVYPSYGVSGGCCSLGYTQFGYAPGVWSTYGYGCAPY